MLRIEELSTSILPAVGSDHWPISLQWQLGESARRKPFKFEKLLLTHPDFSEMIWNWWLNTHVTSSSYMYRMHSKLKLLKAHLKHWNNHTFGNILTNKALLEQEMEHLQ